MQTHVESLPRESALGTFVRRHFQPLVLGVQVAIDLLVVWLACLLAYEIGLQAGGPGAAVPLVDYLPLWGLTGLVCLACFAAFGMYSPVKSLLNVEEFEGVAKSSGVAFLLVIALALLLRPVEPTLAGSRAVESSDSIFSLLRSVHALVAIEIDPDAYSRITVFLTFILILFLTTVSRFFSFKAIQNLHRRGIGNRNALVLGTGPTAQWLLRKFTLVPTLGLRTVGLISHEPEEVGTKVEYDEVLGTFDDLEQIIGQHKVGEVFVALPESSEEHVMGLIERLEELGVTYRVVPRFYHLMSQRVRIENLDSIPLISRPDKRLSFPSYATKRLLDLLLAGTALLLTAPLFLLASLLIRRDSEGPVFYRQTRVGKQGKPFRMFKFRTMYTHLSGDAAAPKDDRDPRITPIGRYLRRYSLDELPQLINVVRGEMSLVGPRPEMPFIVEQYGPLERERLRAKPGITGLWQISYARTEDIHKNLDYDIYYVENRSLLLDVVILFLTVFAVAKGTGSPRRGAASGSPRSRCRSRGSYGC
ncbi:MAG: sugar transferase, partial [Planctomycetota bacterium]